LPPHCRLKLCCIKHHALNFDPTFSLPHTHILHLLSSSHRLTNSYGLRFYLTHTNRNHRPIRSCLAPVLLQTPSPPARSCCSGFESSSIPWGRVSAWTTSHSTSIHRTLTTTTSKRMLSPPVMPQPMMLFLITPAATASASGSEVGSVYSIDCHFLILI